MALLYGPQVVEQRCLFHKLRNVADNCRSEFQGEQKREEKKQFLKQARAVYQAESADEAKRWLVSCGASFAKLAALAVRRELRSPSISRSSTSMLAGPSRRGGILLLPQFLTFAISTLSKGYVTNMANLLTKHNLYIKISLKLSVKTSFFFQRGLNDEGIETNSPGPAAYQPLYSPSANLPGSVGESPGAE